MACGVGQVFLGLPQGRRTGDVMPAEGTEVLLRVDVGDTCGEGVTEGPVRMYRRALPMSQITAATTARSPASKSTVSLSFGAPAKRRPAKARSTIATNRDAQWSTRPNRPTLVG